MNHFYVSIIFLGIILIVIALVGIAYDKKRAMDKAKQLEEKKEELVSVITDAEQMVEELNKFSGYIVTQIEKKNEELHNGLKAADEKIGYINARINEKRDIKIIGGEKVVNGLPMDETDGHRLVVSDIKADLNQERIVHKSPVQEEIQAQKVHSGGREKVIPINSKYSEVLRLADEGLNDTEIAKTLDMGKGEVQLILEMNK